MPPHPSPFCKQVGSVFCNGRSLVVEQCGVSSSKTHRRRRFSSFRSAHQSEILGLVSTEWGRSVLCHHWYVVRGRCWDTKRHKESGQCCSLGWKHAEIVAWRPSRSDQVHLLVRKWTCRRWMLNYCESQTITVKLWGSVVHRFSKEGAWMADNQRPPPYLIRPVGGAVPQPRLTMWEIPSSSMTTLVQHVSDSIYYRVSTFWHTLYEIECKTQQLHALTRNMHIVFFGPFSCQCVSLNVKHWTFFFLKK